MYRFLFIFILFASLVFAKDKNVYSDFLKEKEPSVLFDGCVNVITGNLFIQDKIFSESNKTLSLNKSYFSLSNFDLIKRQQLDSQSFVLGGFSYRNITKAIFKGDGVDIIEPTGEVLSFLANFQKKEKFTHDKIKELELKNIFYLPNYFNTQKPYKNINKIKASLKGPLELYLYYPDGRVKFFKKENIHQSEYLLMQENLLDNSIIKYSYDHFNNLTEIKTCNFNGNQIYSWIRFSYDHADPRYSDKNKDKQDFSMHTSDGKKYDFKFFDYSSIVSNKEKSKFPFYLLENIYSNQKNLNFDYHLNYKTTHPLLKTFNHDKKQKLVDYYLLGSKNQDINIEFFDINDFRFERVKCIKEKNQNNEYCNPKHFFYETQGVFNQTPGTTVVKDAKGNKLVYFYNKEFKIEKIQKFENLNDQDILLYEKNYLWKNIDGDILLISKSLKNQSKTLIQIDYSYDNFKNIIEKKIAGNILKENSIDTKTTKYVYANNNRSLLKEKIKNDKLKYQYNYLPNSNLISEKFTIYEDQIKERFFYEYNPNFDLIKKIHDDGITFDKNDLTNVNFRKIYTFTPSQKANSFGLIEIEEEKYLDLKTNLEKLLSKKIYQYTLGNKILKVDYFDSEDIFVKSENFKYDEKKNLLCKADCFSNKTTYTYDQNNNKTSKTYPNGLKKQYVYDSLNNLIEKKIEFNKEKYSLKYYYDDENNLKAVKDFSNQKSFLDYDFKTNTKSIIQDDKVTKMFLNIFSNPLNITLENNKEKSFTYNIDNTINKMIDLDGKISTFAYDFLNRKTLENIYLSNGKLQDEIFYKYNLFSLEEVKQNDFTKSYFYDSALRCIKEIDTSSEDSVETTYEYDSTSHVSRATYLDIYEEETIKDPQENIIEKSFSAYGNLVYKKCYYDMEKSSFDLKSYLQSKIDKENFQNSHDSHSKKKNALDLSNEKDRYKDNGKDIEKDSNNDSNVKEDSFLSTISEKDQFFYSVRDLKDPIKNFLHLDFFDRFINPKNSIYLPSSGSKDEYRDTYFNVVDEDLKRSLNIFYVELYLDEDFNIDKMFLKPSFFDIEKNKVKVIFYEDALNNLFKNKTPLEYVLKALKVFDSIKEISETEYMITKSNMRILFTLVDNTFYIENVNFSK